MEDIASELLQNSLEDLLLFMDLLLKRCEQKQAPVQGILCILLMIPTPSLITEQTSLQKQCEKKIRIAALRLSRLPSFQKCLMAFVANAPEQLFHKIDRPQLLADLFVRGFSRVNQNVDFAVQSLSGLFVLITEHGLQYPGYYQKLYEFTEPTILRKTLRCQGKYRFLKLMRASLLSQDIPSLIVASFVKRLVRFGVHDGSISGTLFALRLSAELVVTHPSVRSLIHEGSSDKKCMQEFDSKQKDPLKSNALNSQLWELEALKKHAHPAIGAVVRLFSTPLDSPNVAEELQSTQKVSKLSIRAFLKQDMKELRKISRIQ